MELNFQRCGYTKVSGCRGSAEDVISARAGFRFRLDLLVTTRPLTGCHATNILEYSNLPIRLASGLRFRIFELFGPLRKVVGPRSAAVGGRSEKSA